MCGIVGYAGQEDAMPLLLKGLQQLEYRGYDSAGIATVHKHKIQLQKSVGPVECLAKLLAQQPLPGSAGIGHTRWATHGKPSVLNAHPHVCRQVAVVHNGIIENYQELQQPFAKADFQSETDTEVIAHLISACLNIGDSPQQAMAKVLPQLKGKFSMVVLFEGRQPMLIGAKKGSPLAVGFKKNGLLFGSDKTALVALESQNIHYLKEGSWAVVEENKLKIFDEHHQEIQPIFEDIKISQLAITKGRFKHYMLKEIHQQPEVVGLTIQSWQNSQKTAATLAKITKSVSLANGISLVACGTAFYAAMVAKYWLEQLAKIRVEVDVASEFRYRQPVLPENGLAVFISQSGETMDTLEAARFAAQKGQKLLAIVNNPDSTLAREADFVFITEAGPEIGVASTKAFTTQLSVLLGLSLDFARLRKTMHESELQKRWLTLGALPKTLSAVLALEPHFLKLAQELSGFKNIFYVGRGAIWPIALEGALKIKEIAYINAQGYAAGELKHGPIALVDKKTAVIVLAPPDELFEKMHANIQEIVARAGQVIVISDQAGCARLSKSCQLWHCIALPTVDHVLNPILYTVPIQLLAYHVADVLGCNIDKPRNLAKSVTVE